MIYQHPQNWPVGKVCSELCLSPWLAPPTSRRGIWVSLLAKYTQSTLYSSSALTQQLLFLVLIQIYVSSIILSAHASAKLNTVKTAIYWSCDIFEGNVRAFTKA